ncbi:Gfo/Idh/MocA family protein [Christiangramia flava]|uniref:Oxidoreductase domain protein n=1 Tax=Christiangramia flava JLT2011 TaxID=1229726 RepID=A0A1L7I5N4_9FLAO|nr:Gfo/Idh/MocA family oxidoreductase [Christiangramia flava]APU68896.1 oxidoreductase domain protein [Christiangramia flava JLT2011]OSS38958.1 oxidoreductase domain protein [Christiangramia flava JLT2011]
MKKSFDVGFIGSGFAAEFHLAALRKVYDVKIQVVGAYSPTKSNLEEFCTKQALEAFSSAEELISRVDVVHICTPPSTHESLCIQALKQHRQVIVEKPLTGYFGEEADDFSGDTFPREKGFEKAVQSLQNILKAEKESDGQIFYAENWIYAPAIQKEKEVIEKTKSQVLWIQAQQSHSGSHSLAYGKWRLSGGGSLMGKGCHPLSGAIFLKYVEGKTRNHQPIRPKSVSCRVHKITRLPNFENELHLKDSYTDVEDYASLHVVFEDNMIADITASELLHGGVKNYLEVHANNHRTICNLTPNNAMQTYNPVHSNFDDIYVVEKTGTKQGWSNISPDEAWFNGYQHEMQAFYTGMASGEKPDSDSQLAADVIATIYAAYISAEQNGREVEIPKI